MLARLSVLFFSFGCAEGSLFYGSGARGGRQLTIQTLNLFDQRVSHDPKTRWSGDWIFRRQRLEAVDTGLRDAKPDVLLLQGVMERRESLYDADREILKAGALYGYQWYQVGVEHYEDTDEEKSLAVAAGLPVELAMKDRPHKWWRIGKEGYLSVVRLTIDGEPLLLFNVQMPRKSRSGEDRHYGFLYWRVREQLAEQGVCDQRVMLGGQFAGDGGDPDYQNLLQELRLRDASEGYCEVESDCYTATPTNRLYRQAYGDRRPVRRDRLLVHLKAEVFSSERNFYRSEPYEIINHATYGLERLWPSAHYGWKTVVRLPSCPPPTL